MGLSSQIAEREDAVLCSDVRGKWTLSLQIYSLKEWVLTYCFWNRGSVWMDRRCIFSLLRSWTQVNNGLNQSDRIEYLRLNALSKVSCIRCWRLEIFLRIQVLRFLNWKLLHILWHEFEWQLVCLQGSVEYSGSGMGVLTLAHIDLDSDS